MSNGRTIIGINFRNTAGYMTDGPDDVDWDADVYPTVRTASGGQSFTGGWTSTPTYTGLNRRQDYGARLAGLFYEFGSASPDFRVDLPSSGSWDFYLAAGDRGFSGNYSEWQIKDSSTTLFSSATRASLNYLASTDATDGGVNATSHDWFEDSPDGGIQSDSYSSTEFHFILNYNGVNGANSAVVQHIRLESGTYTEASYSAWNAGVNFRGSSGYVTDGNDDTYSLHTDQYPTTRSNANGTSLTFGWEYGRPTGSVDRSSSIDVRLAGINYQTGSQGHPWRMDLPSPGNYDVELGIGDSGFGSYAEFQLWDGGTLLSSSGTTALGLSEYVDATDTKHTSAANWASSQTAVNHDFATDIFRVNMNYKGVDGTNNAVINHVHLTRIETASDIYPSEYERDGNLALMSHWRAPAPLLQYQLSVGPEWDPALFPVVTGTSAATAPAVTASGSGSFAPGTDTGSAAATAPAATASGSGLFYPSLGTGTAALEVPAATALGVGIYSAASLHFGSIVTAVPAVEAVAAGTFARHTSHPFKRRFSDSGTDLRRRTEGTETAYRKRPDEHSGERQSER